MRRSLVTALAVATLSLLPPVIARADMLCGGGHPPPDPSPSPSSSASGSSSADAGPVGQSFTTPCGNRGGGDASPLMPTEVGMLFGMVTLGLAAGVASRREKKG